MSSNGPQLSLDCYRPDSPESEGIAEIPDYAGDSDMDICDNRDCPTPESSIGEHDGSVSGKT